MKRNPGYLIRHVGGKVLLVPIGRQVSNSSDIVLLNEAGHFLWTLLEHEHSLEDLADALAGQFGLPRKQALDDTQAFLHASPNILAERGSP